MSPPGKSPIPTVALSGAGSFTGIWIARVFREAGWQVHALCSGQPESYSRLRALRMEELRKHATAHFGLRAEEGTFEQWIRGNRPAIWVNHHHWMQDYRSADYDEARALDLGIRPLAGIAHALSDVGALGVIQSGTYFEPGEGGRGPDSPVTPYARSKGKVWEAWKALEDRHHVPVSKVVIPNPIGPYENSDRFLPILVSRAREKGEFKIQAPDDEGDQLPAEDLGRVYLDAAQALMKGAAGRIWRPSGRVVRMEDWAREAGQELIVRRLGWEPPRLQITAASKPPTRHRNPPEEARSVDWARFWDQCAAYFKTGPC